MGRYVHADGCFDGCFYVYLYVFIYVYVYKYVHGVKEANVHPDYLPYHP